MRSDTQPSGDGQPLAKPQPIIAPLQLDSVAVGVDDTRELMGSPTSVGASAALEDLQSAHRRRQRAGAVAGVTLLVLLSVGIAVAIMVSKSGKPSVALPQQFSGEFTTYDRAFPDLRYTGRLHKSVSAEGRSLFDMTLSYTDPITSEHVVVTLINQRLYKQTFNSSASETPTSSGCFPPQLVPPLGDIEELFTRAVLTPASVLDQSNPGMAPCLAAGHRYLIQWGTQDFVYCNPQNDVHVVVGDNFHMNFVSDAYVKPLAASVPLSVATGEPLECEPLDDASVLDKDFSSVPLARRRLTKDVGAGRKLSAQRPCLFVGGNGLDSDQTPTSSSGTYDYWGPAITQSLGSVCTSYTFLRRNFKSKGWDDPGTMQHICDEAHALGSSGTKIGSVTIFSHGAGSLAVAAALNSNRCEFSSLTKWYSASGMFAGAEVANRGLSDICPAYSAMKDMLDVLHFCKGKNHDNLEWGVESTQSSYVNAQGITTVATSNLDGAMCGDDPEGLYVSIGQGIKDLDDRVTTWGSATRDGYVKIASCKVIKSSSSWSMSSTTRWAHLHLNYADTTARFGNPYADPSNDHSPLTWYLTMGARA